MKQHKFFRKFNIIIGLLMLTIGIIFGSYFVLQSDIGTASITQQLSQMLEQNTELITGCNPNPNDKNQDSDNDGLKDWEELTWETNPCVPDTDKDGYLDGEETNSGHNPVQPAPGDKLSDRETSPRALPANLTQALSKSLAQKTIEGEIQPITDETDFAAFDANYPVISSAIQETMEQSYEEFSLPNINDGEIIISNDNSSEAIESYGEKIVEIMNKWANKIKIAETGTSKFETETHLFYEAINNQDFTEVDKYIQFYQNVYQDIKQISAPSNFKDIHKEQLGIFWIMNNIYKTIRQTEIDPIKSALALEKYKSTSELTMQLIQKIANKLQEIE